MKNVEEFCTRVRFSYIFFPAIENGEEHCIQVGLAFSFFCFPRKTSYLKKSSERVGWCIILKPFQFSRDSNEI